MLPLTTIETLHYAVVLSEEGSLSRAAERLHVSHSQISRKIKALQAVWGVPLFDRTLDGFVPTEEGRAALSEIRTVLEHTRRGFYRARLIHATRRGPLQIGISPQIHPSIPPLLRQTVMPLEQFSGVVVTVDTMPRLRRAVLAGRLHIAFALMPIQDRDLWVQPVREEGFCMCLPESHPLKERPRLALREVLSQPLCWMARSVQPFLYDEVSAYLQAIGFESKQIVESSDIFGCIEFAVNRFGCSLLPASAMSLRRDGIVSKPVTDATIRMQTGILARKDQMRGGISDYIERLGS